MQILIANLHERHFRYLLIALWQQVKTVAQVGKVGVNAERPGVSVGFYLLAFAG